MIFQQKKVKEIQIVLLFLMTYVVGTIFNHRENIISAISIISQALLAYDIGILYCTKKYKDSISKSLKKIITVYLYIDILCIFLNFSERILNISYVLTFLGYDNYAAFYIIPMLSVKLYLDSKEHNGITKEDFFCWLLCLLGKIYTKSFTASVAILALMFVYVLLSNIKFVKRIFNVKAIFLLLVALFCGIYFFNIHTVISFLLNSSGKGIELNSRTVIWHQVVPRLTTIPIMGLGCIDEYMFMKFFGFPYGYSVTHAHNLVLDILCSTGIIGLYLYIKIILDTKIKRVYLINGSYRILLCGLISYLIIGFFDAYPFLSGVYLLLGFLKSAVHIESERKTRMGDK